jgi:hypothetical protein
MEIVETGSLRRIAYENTEEVKVGKVFTQIYGVGTSAILVSGTSRSCRGTLRTRDRSPLVPTGMSHAD